MATKKKREILYGDIKYISLCPRGMNGFTTLFKAEGSQAEFKGMSKAVGDVMEKGELLAVVWAPDVADGEGDYASAETVEKMAHSFMKNVAKVDLVHDLDELPREAAYVTESFIIQENDERFSGWEDYKGNVVDVTGGWAVKIQIDSPELRKAYRDGDWAGVSMYGDATVRVDAQKADKIGVVVEKNKRLLTALRAWFEQSGDVNAVDLTAFRSFDRDQLMVNLTQHLTVDMGFEQKPAVIMAAKIADSIPTENEIMNEEQVNALVAKAIEDATAPLLKQIEALKAAAPVETPVVEAKKTDEEIAAEKAAADEAAAIKKAGDEAAAAVAKEEADKEAALAKEIHDAADAAAEPEVDDDTEIDVSEMDDEALLAYAAEQQVEALKADTDFSDPESIKKFVEARKAILGTPVKKAAKKKKLRRNVTVKAATEAETTVSKQVEDGKSLADYINKKRGKA